MQLTFDQLLTEHKQQQQLVLLRDKLPSILREDSWYLERVWCSIDHAWRWQCGHYHTGLKTLTHKSQDDAIAQAMHVAFFYELMPRDELIQYNKLYMPHRLVRPPSAYHLYTYDHNKAKRWQVEYSERHR